MKLVIRRDQADIKGAFGGHKGVMFSLSYRLELTEYEQGLVERYKLHTHVLNHRTFGDVIQGVTEQLQSVEILISNEKAIRDACEDFNVLLKVAATFGGEEVVEIGS